LGVTQFAKGGTLATTQFAPFHKSGRAIRATLVASSYPSRAHVPDQECIK
jgi:hypothetical protein